MRHLVTLQRSGEILHFGARLLTTIKSRRAWPVVIYNDLVKDDVPVAATGQMSLRRSGPTGRTTISSKTTFRSQRPARCHYDNLAPRDAQGPFRRPGRAQTLSFAFSVKRRCAACCDSAAGPPPRRHQKACSLYPLLPPRQPHLKVHENSLGQNSTPLLSFASP